MASQKLSDLYYARIPHTDPGQLELLEHFERLRGELDSFHQPKKLSLFKKKRSIKGIYLWGSVGRGKTCLMDLFYESMTLPQKRREHFHIFMQEIHARIKQLKSLDLVADEVAAQVKLLCFDEFQVTNIADAMIMSRFFERLMEKGVVMVTTSNVAPKDLYLNGLGREHFLPFIDLLSSHMEILKIEDGIDYRKENRQNAPSDLLNSWKALTNGNEVETLHLKKGLRTIEVKQSAGDYAWFTFDDLCAKPLGVRDYLLLSHHYKGIFVDPLPTLTSAERNEAHRLMTLVDVLYERKIPLYYSGTIDPDQIYTQGEGVKAFERTASRLYEMRKWYTNGN